jgi:hypothetical protein
VKKINILFVSIAFPPKNDPECLQTSRYFKYLANESDFSISVVTSPTPSLYMPFDAGLLKYDSGYSQKIEVPITESKLSNYVLRKLGFGSFLFPDSKMTFHWRWKEVVKKLKDKPDIIYSRSNPMSSAFMAFKLHKYYGCPWIMHLSDPWGLSPLQEHSQTEKIVKSENELLHHASAITVTSSKTLQLYTNQFPELASKFVVLPNVYDPNDIREPHFSKTEKLTIVYTGGITANRNVRFLEIVLKRMNEVEQGATDQVEFVFAGDVDRENRIFFEQDHTAIKHVGMLSYKEVQVLYEKAHLLLVVDNPTQGAGAVFFPSKILDYFTTRKKVIAITPEDSTTREVLADYLHKAFTHQEIDKIAQCFIEELQNFRQANLLSFQAKNIPMQYDARVNAQKLSSWLKAFPARG